MLSKLRRRAEEEKGFTLIELLVVILIIGILAAIAIPSFLGQRAKAQDSDAKAGVRTAQTAMETFCHRQRRKYTNGNLAKIETSSPRWPTPTASPSAPRPTPATRSRSTSKSTTARSSPSPATRDGTISRTCDQAARAPASPTAPGSPLGHSTIREAGLRARLAPLAAGIGTFADAGFRPGRAAPMTERMPLRERLSSRRRLHPDRDAGRGDDPRDRPGRDGAPGLDGRATRRCATAPAKVGYALSREVLESARAIPYSDLTAAQIVPKLQAQTRPRRPARRRATRQAPRHRLHGRRDGLLLRRPVGLLGAARRRRLLPRLPGDHQRRHPRLRDGLGRRLDRARRRDPGRLQAGRHHDQLDAGRDQPQDRPRR